MPYTAQERANALRYALALMRDRLTVEAPLNAAAIQRHIDALIELVATAPPYEDPAFTDDDPSTVPEGTGDTWGPPLRKPVR